MLKSISRMIYRLAIAIMILAAIAGSQAESQTVSQSDYDDYPQFVGYVNDYAHILSAPQASALNQEIRDFDNRTTIELAVVTVESIGSQSPQSYAINLANLWGVGKRGLNNGIIMLVAMQSHDIWIEAGTGLRDRMSNEQIQGIVNGIMIPRFRAGQPDRGVIDGVHGIINHFGASNANVMEIAPILAAPRDEGIVDPKLFISAVGFLLLASLVIAVPVIIKRRAKAEKNREKLERLRKALDEIVSEETAALEALRELKASFANSIWLEAEEAFGRVDHEGLELELLTVKRSSDRGLIFADQTEARADELERRLDTALEDARAPKKRLEQARRAQRECPEILAGLEPAILQAEREVMEGEVSISTRMKLGSARHIQKEAVAAAGGPPESVDWIGLLGQLEKLQKTIEEIASDALRDRAIAEKIRGQDRDELLAIMNERMAKAEKELAGSSAAIGELSAARAEYERVRESTPGRLNNIDLYLIMNSIDHRVKLGHQHRRRAEEVARKQEEARKREEATAARHSGFGSSGSGGFGGGSMGGGSSGGGKW